ncbi:hypothetical protein Tco_0568855 [Tanacetum coccineum]
MSTTNSPLKRNVTTTIQGPERRRTEPGESSGPARPNYASTVTILNCFQDVYGLGVNLAKSSIFSIDININEVKKVASTFNCKYGSLPFIYLGLPVGKDMSRGNNWLEIINSLNKRLSSWKAKLVSFGGRLTLTKEVLGSLPLYYLSLFRAPKKVITMMERICSRFFWGFKDDEKGIYWVKWSSVLANFDVVGLYIGSIYAKNLGLLAKWRWRFFNESGALWQRVIRSLHGVDGGFSSNSGNGLRCKKGVWEGITDIGLVTNNTGMCGMLVGLAYPPHSRTLTELQDLSTLLSGLFPHEGTDGWRWPLDPLNSFLVKRISRLIDDSLSSTLEVARPMSGTLLTDWRDIGAGISFKTDLLVPSLVIKSMAMFSHFQWGISVGDACFYVRAIVDGTMSLKGEILADVRLLSTRFHVLAIIASIALTSCLSEVSLVRESHNLRDSNSQKGSVIRSLD